MSLLALFSLVQNRNRNLISNAARSNAIVTQLFPDTIRDKLLNQPTNTGQNLISYLQGDDVVSNSQPLADLFLETSIIFADVSGFTAVCIIHNCDEFMPVQRQV